MENEAAKSLSNKERLAVVETLMTEVQDQKGGQLSADQVTKLEGLKPAVNGSINFFVDSIAELYGPKAIARETRDGLLEVLTGLKSAISLAVKYGDDFDRSILE